MKTILMFVFAALALMSMGSAVYAEETGCYQTSDRWIIRVFSGGVAIPYSFTLAVSDPATGALIPHSDIKAFSGGVSPCLNPDSATTNLCVIEQNADNTDVSLACDAAAGTAYVFHDSGGTPTLTTLADIKSLPVAGGVLSTNKTQMLFGSVARGAYKQISVTATNTGTAPLPMLPVTPPSAPFSIVSNACAGVTLAPAGTCIIKVRFSPTAVTAYTGSFTINSTGGNIAITLKGNGY
ncbi:MAG: choice-of-anchor D domain-containing protein [Nitrospirae bacterium]|nr:choice-of-anchor D domain-containing protein [Nitrospirota bacterium]